MGEDYYKSDHVEKCSYSEGQLTGLVRASMRDEVYLVSVSIGDQGILFTTCECHSGVHKCSHAAALAIFAVHDIGYTDVECEWRKPAVPNQVQSVEDLYPAEDYNPLSRESTEEDLQWLRNRLCGQVQWNGMAP